MTGRPSSSHGIAILLLLLFPATVRYTTIRVGSPQASRPSPRAQDEPQARPGGSGAGAARLRPSMQSKRRVMDSRIQETMSCRTRPFGVGLVGGWARQKDNGWASGVAIRTTCSSVCPKYHLRCAAYCAAAWMILLEGGREDAEREDAGRGREGGRGTEWHRGGTDGEREGGRERGREVGR